MTAPARVSVAILVLLVVLFLIALEPPIAAPAWVQSVIAIALVGWWLQRSRGPR